MEIKIFDSKGEVMAERYYYPKDRRKETRFKLDGARAGIYVVNIIIEDVVKTARMRLT